MVVLGFAVMRSSKLYTWSWEVGSGWMELEYGLNKECLNSIILLRPPFTFPPFTRRASTRVLAAENDLSVIFRGTCGGLFVFDLKFGRLRKISDRSDDCNIRGILPYRSFCSLRSSS
ncbi:hypothetical protein PR202_gb12131 [Eleusine coracana subsp. coracana]|uniref:Uncharacterized protein n=1 Tax=Eleusine coracana subsp. coracana TaxID=191504 RepID=A0AAV5ENR8_ELECO|nr:hypothetical protein PR202_gb12131 [Eleusine coracana subsp. coracana]